MTNTRQTEPTSKRKVVQLSSVHPPDDIRVFVKECRSLAAAGYDVVYVVPTTHDYGVVDGVRVKPITPSGGRLRRVLGTATRVVKAAAAERGDVYHFHDPELLPFMVILKWLRPSTKVVYDTHEDMPAAIADKAWLPVWLRTPVAIGVRMTERFAAIFLDGIVAATPAIARNFPASKTVVVQNFPQLNEFSKVERKPRADGEANVVYTGRIDGDTLGPAAIEAVERVGQNGFEVRLTIAGKFVSQAYRQEVEALPGWSNVDYVGWQNRVQLLELLRRADVGLVLLQEGKNHIEAQPNKMFEYMAAGLPVITSNFPLWRTIVEGSGAGFVVDPANAEEIATALERLIENPMEAFTMGERGRKAVQEKFNWEREAAVLTGLYLRLFASRNIECGSTL